MILSLWMTMKHVIASVAEQIFDTLLAFYDGANRSAELTLQSHLGGILLHDVL